MHVRIAVLRGERLALTALIVGALAIAFSPIFVRLSELGPTATAFHRVALAVPALWAVLGLESRRARPRPPSRRQIGMLVLAGIAFGGDLAFWHWSIKLTSVANATLFANFTPIFVTIGAYFLLKETIRPAFVLGLALALSGAVLLMGSSVTLSLDHLIGDALGVVTAMFYGSYILIVARLRGAVPAIRLMTLTGLVTAIVLLPVVLLSGESLMPRTLYGWAVLLGLAWGSHAAGQSLIAYALARLPASFSSVGLLIQPVAAALLAWALLAEPLGVLQALGGAVVLAGVLVARLASRPA
ncbi:MAG TPA: DMT family transporter [Alphaproteobacteria bacterium]|nr:DMT family transporter [Alphaproteobacteria bacterium]